MSSLGVGFCGFHWMGDKDGFSNELYLEAQRQRILARTQGTDRLYLEFGGKIMFDFHAARVLPGYDPNVKIRLLKSLAAECEVICCVGAKQIEGRKRRADFGITYDADVLKMIQDLQAQGIPVISVVITQFTNQPAAVRFRDFLLAKGMVVFTHPPIAGYPDDIEHIVSEHGYGTCPYIPVTKKLVILTAPGPGAGKLATCLSQLYHEFRSGLNSRYSKFESFPVWNLPLDHPINQAYEAATLDLLDFNLIDPFHEKAYGVQTVNYNRDVEAFPLLSRLFAKITMQECAYKSPTDMGVNMIAEGIVNDSICRDAASQEVIRRYFICRAELVDGTSSQAMVKKAEELMAKVGVVPESRAVVSPGRVAGAALQVHDGRIVLGATIAEVVVKAASLLAGIETPVLSTASLEGVAQLKAMGVTPEPPIPTVYDVLVALAASAMPNAKAASFQIPALYGCQAHSGKLLLPLDIQGLRKIGVQVTSETSLYP